MQAHFPHWSCLTLREQVCQLVVMHASHPAFGLPLAPDKLVAFLGRYPVGAIFVGGEVIEDGLNRYETVHKRVRQIQALSRIPLLVSADLENGCGDVIPGLTPLPYPMALGAANDPDLALEYGRACAREGALAGINWALAPMADLNLHPLSSNVGVRAFGDNAGRVSPLLRAFVRGVQEEGMAACAKTFPGDGTDYRDQHLTRTENRLPMAEWRTSCGRTFAQLIEEDVATVMSAHISLPHYQQFRDARNLPLPATVCRELITGLLKGEMGFKGAVVTDAFGMGGIRNSHSHLEASVESFVAGHDLFLWPDLRVVDELVERLERGEIPMSRLEDALDRVWRLKTRYAHAPKIHADAGTHAAAVSRRTAEAGLTLLWNRDKILPLSPLRHRRVLLIATTPHDKAADRFHILADELCKRGHAVEVLRHISPEELEQREPDFDLLLYCVERQFHRPLGAMDLFGEDARNFWAACMFGREKTVAIGFGSPYLAPWYFETAAAALNAYSSVPDCQLAAAKALCGELLCTGTMPVAWEGRHSITVPV